MERAFADAAEDSKQAASSAAETPVSPAAAAAVQREGPSSNIAPPSSPSPHRSVPQTSASEDGGARASFPGVGDGDEDQEPLELLTPPPPAEMAPSAAGRIGRLPSSFSDSSTEEGNQGFEGGNGDEVDDGGSGDASGYKAAVSHAEGDRRGEGATGAREKAARNLGNMRGFAAGAFEDGDGHHDRRILSSRRRTIGAGVGRAAARGTLAESLENDHRFTPNLPDLRLVASPISEEVDSFAATRAAVRARLESRSSLLGSARRLSTPSGIGRTFDEAAVPAGVMASPRYWESASASSRTAFDRDTIFLSSQM